jgi:hypothetical protein
MHVRAYCKMCMLQQNTAAASSTTYLITSCSACSNWSAIICTQVGWLWLTVSCLAAVPPDADWHLQPCIIRKFTACCYTAPALLGPQAQT